MNDTGKAQDAAAPVIQPSVAPAPDTFVTPDSSSAPIMPTPSDSGGPVSESGLPDSGVIAPVVTPTIPPAPDMGAIPQTEEQSSAPEMPIPAPEPKAEEHQEPAASGVNGVNFEENLPAPDMAQPELASDYSQPAPSAAAPPADVNSDELLGIKRQALQSLAPLVDELDQTPEEKFKTTMMLIQASDNPDLVKEAFAAANQISDEKNRAQALLDVVNEINYFTQPHHEDDAAAAV